MKILITGATGFIGGKLTLFLADQGNTVHILCRTKPSNEFLRHPNIKVFNGHLSDPDSIHKAMLGCQQVYHLAAFAKVWHPQKNTFYEINVQGAENIFDAALRKQVEKVVFTSTAGVLGPSDKENEPIHEKSKRLFDFFTLYEQSKAEAENTAQKYVKKGLNIVTVNPTRVYGPGTLSESNAVTQLIHQFKQGKWRLIPGDGSKIGNYVYVDDVVQGHIQAMEKGKSGERYILGGENINYSTLFLLLRKTTGKTQKLYKIPISIMLLFAYLQLFLANLGLKKPLITPNWVRRYLYHWPLSSQKAQEELAYDPVSLEEGIQKTLQWLNNKE